MRIKYGKSEQVVYREIKSMIPCLFFALLTILIYEINDNWTLSLIAVLIITAYSVLSFIIDNTIFTNERLVIRQQLIREYSIYYTDVLQMTIVRNKYINYGDYGTIRIITATKTYDIKIRNLSKTYDRIANMITTIKDKEGELDKINGLVAKKPKFMRWKGNIESLLDSSNKEVIVIYESNWNTEAKNNVTKTICALANDYTMGGGFIIIGIEKGELGPILPPKSLNGIQLEQIEKEIRKASKLITPSYPYEINIIGANYQGINILILSVYWSFENPHYAPDNIDEMNSNYSKYVIDYAESMGSPPNDDIDKSNNMLSAEHDITETNNKNILKYKVVKVDDYAFSFYKKGDYWLVGEVEHEVIIKHSNGLSYIHFLLDNPNEEHPVEIVYSLGKDPKIDVASQPPNSEVEYVDDAMREILDDTTENEIRAAIKNLEEKREDLYSEHEKEFDYEDNKELTERQAPQDKYLVEKEKLESQLLILRNYLREGRLGKDKHKFKDKTLESVRTTVYTSIKSAIKIIHKELPILEDFIKLKYTIITGGKIKYQPKNNKPVEWVLYPPAPPTS